MKIINKLTIDLKPYKNNSKLHPKEQMEVIKKSIKEFGFRNPILIDKNNCIIAGHGRVLAAKELDIDKVPCLMVEDLTKAQIKAYRIMDNKSAESEWSFDMLKLEFEDLHKDGYDLDMTGFLEDERHDIFEFNEEPIETQEDEFDTEGALKEPKYNVKKGEIWKLGNNRLMCGDSTDKDTVDKLMDGNKADMIFTDPPYNVSFNGRSSKFEVILNDNLKDADFNKFIEKIALIIQGLNIDTYYIWCNWKFYGLLQKHFEFKSCIVWAKNVFGLGRGYRHQHEFCLFNGKIDSSITNESDLWSVSKDSKYVHPTQKPIELCARAIKNSKPKSILDLFGGSGSTLIACEQLKRKCYMMELDPKYCSVIIERWEEYTNKKGVIVK